MVYPKISVKKITASVLVTGILFGTFTVTQAQSTSEKLLQGHLKLKEQEIKEQEAKLQQEEGKAQAIAGEVYELSGQVKSAQNKIQSKQQKIETIIAGIGAKERTVIELENQVEQDRESLEVMVRRVKKLDDVSMVEIILGGETMNELFTSLDSYAVIKETLQNQLEATRTYQEQTKQERLALEQSRSQEEQLKYEIQNEKQQIEQMKAVQESMLVLKKQDVKEYEKVVAQKKAEAAKIKQRLFTLRNSNRGAGIPFASALQYAEAAEARTGVRAAFILGILKQESNLGQNVGTCNRVGDPPSKGYREIMHPNRDIEPYLRITAKLGLDPETQPLSCAASIGYGGAMGPSQFIPSTWEIYENQISGVTGNYPANPWNPQDAFAATSVFLQDLGANKGTYAAEREAAARYYAGGYWQQNGLGYADSVLRHASDIQTAMIDPIKAAQGF